MHVVIHKSWALVAHIFSKTCEEEKYWRSFLVKSDVNIHKNSDDGHFFFSNKYNDEITLSISVIAFFKSHNEHKKIVTSN